MHVQQISLGLLFLEFHHVFLRFYDLMKFSMAGSREDIQIINSTSLWNISPHNSHFSLGLDPFNRNVLHNKTSIFLGIDV